MKDNNLLSEKAVATTSLYLIKNLQQLWQDDLPTSGNEISQIFHLAIWFRKHIYHTQQKS